ncbi:DUF4097 family beta strand repeat-containing protein [Actinoplanes teichomyceticus]|uniref:Putative adhesin n=1 Tax=Actinoplanes teichomyceticus TaxID=1867 RepID=A0A561WI43_ACTTI|nr:DUF4097 family beta strand repeat-containing protein [Actinoplanes teichomyceticus]TWG23526.1 putative adhesin [Actinoplanes teichomyceticus]GIF16150.1 hypothetical protein Ate01nite_61820 [Actinoplanes teichomyceticus]
MSRTVALVLAAASVAALAGCDGVVGATMTFEDTERAKITDIVVSGGSGDVIVTTADVTDTRIKRTVRGGNGSGPTYRIAGTTLTLPTECGFDCHIVYEVQAPTGVKVRGDLRSGSVNLTGVGAVDLTLSSGDVMIDGASAPVRVKATSGQVSVTRAPGAILEATSGDITALEISGPVQARVTSGSLDLELAEPASVTASVTSGDLMLLVPEGRYRINDHTADGDTHIDGLTEDPQSPNVLDLRARSGDLTVGTR